MKAVVITKFGAPNVLELVDHPDPTLADDEVLIAVKAAGVNRPDIAQRKGNYPPPPGAPQDIPGLEVAGIVVATGKEVVGFDTGDRVCALIVGGGYAQYATAKATHCLPIPKNLDFIEAASLPETVFTVWSNVFERGRLTAGENFLVHGGTSGIGITAIQLAKALGAKVYTTAGSDEKCQACLDLGAEQAINYKSQAFEDVLVDVGIDVVLDMIGGEYFRKNIHIMNHDGRLVYINAMGGADVHLDIREVMQKRIYITGSTLRNRDKKFKANLTQAVKENVWPLIESGKFKPMVFAEFALEDAAKAHELLETSKHIGKIVLTNAYTDL
ncbi:putative PIG3 family NAD(P)H quinone oxidoreductase [Chitinophaga skermanii]|uniref:Putative PIG3 family NAD(P)H quinone oxidoreductase n=1 Tax=Chitinophaga skermanii TaxID=331697 RepID=A0A327QY09_9BACT|nr:NAD(P)H-quinone oxidoreductase [Chitinophaga skermanii]RAJ08614.1 putative PIG3 family NAD(P)H quinone oxidoreductase [Chitinophaga skermanii]